MSRTVKEWIGKNDDEAIPVRVKLRVYVRFDGRCAECTAGAGRHHQYDHVVALANGGENRERNLQLLCLSCHTLKTKVDVARKRIDNRVKAKHLGIKKRKGRPMPGSRASGIKFKIGGGWERR